MVRPVESVARVFQASVILAVVFAAPAAAQTFTIDRAMSAATIEVGKAGLFSFAAGHTHEVTGPIENGIVTIDAQDAAKSSIQLVIATARLKVSAKGEPPDDVPKVQQAMEGEKVLNIALYPRITFKSTAVNGVPREQAPTFDATVTGTLTIREKSQPVTATVHVQRGSGSVTATGRFAIKQTAFGIQPISVAGVVKVEDELRISFRIIAKQ